MYALICIVVFFTTSDLVAGFANSLIIASASSIISGLCVFIGAYRLKVAELDTTISGGAEFIKQNFSKANIIFSILDIICAIIALMTGIVIIGLIFRATFAVRLIVIMNKFQTITRFVLVGSLIYLVRRICLMSELKMTKGQWVVFGIFCAGAVYAILSAVIPQITIFGDTFLQMLLCCGIEGVVGGVGIFMKGANKTEAELEESKRKLDLLTTKRLEKMAKAEAKEELKKAQNNELSALTEKHKALLLEQQRKALEEQQANITETQA